MCYSVFWRLFSVRWRMLDVLDVPEVMCCVLLRVLEAVEGVLCLLENVGGTEGVGGDAMCASPYAGGDALCATLYSGGCGGWA